MRQLRVRTLRLVLTLSLTILSVLPLNIYRAQAVIANTSFSYWSPFGSRVDNLVYTAYSDFTTMFTAFKSGQLDITDWPIQPADLPGFINSPDFFVTPKQAELGIFQLDLNHISSAPFLGVNMQVARSTSNTACIIPPGGNLLSISPTCPNPPIAPGTPSLVITSSAPGCTSATFGLVIHLKNIEEGSVLIRDPYNNVTITYTGQTVPLATKGDDNPVNPSGTYTLPCEASLFPSYSISTTAYSGTITLFTSGGTQPVCTGGNVCQADFSVNYNSLSTMKPTIASFFIGRALSHLLDKPNFLTVPNLQSLADCDDIFASPSQDLMATIGAGACNNLSAAPASVVNAECTDATLQDLFTAAGAVCSPVSLYNLRADSVGSCPSTVFCVPTQSASPPPAGYSGVLDLAAACVYLVDAGFTITGATGTTTGQKCLSVAQGTGHLSTSPAGLQVSIYIRTHPPRKDFGTIVADSLNYLFGTPTGGTVCYGTLGSPGTSSGCPTSLLTPAYYTISQVTKPVFQGSNNWNLYTGGYSLTPNPDHLYSIYYSQFANTQCGGRNTSLPPDYSFYCDPAYDTQSFSGEFPSVARLSLPFFQQTAILGATRGGVVSVYSGENQFVALNAWNWEQVPPGTSSSLVSVLGHGFEAGSGFLSNMRPVPGYVPANSLYYASGTSNPTLQNTIRRGMSQTTLHINLFTSTTVWEFEPLIQVYDSMLLINPNTGGSNLQLVDWMTTSHSTSFDPATNLSTQVWNLRNDILWHDGQAVTAGDVCYSLLAYKNIPSANLFPSVQPVVSCSPVSAKSLILTLTGQSPFFEFNIGTLPIIPAHVWASYCGVPPSPSFVNPAVGVNCGSPSFDPVALGIMVGSGPWVCNSSVGVSTIPGQKSCTQNADGSPGTQAVSAGGRMLLKRDFGYMRCCDNAEPSNLPPSSLEALEWADGNKDGRVTILDLAAAALHFGSYDPYWANPLYSSSGGTVVDVGDIATMALYFDHALTNPLLGTPTGPYTATPPASLIGIDPKTDPFRFDLGGGNLAYYMGLTFPSGTATIQLRIIAGVAMPSSFTATITNPPSGYTGPSTVAGVAGSTPGSILLSFPGLAAGHYIFILNFGATKLITIET